MNPLRDYYDGLRDAPVPARLLAETPGEAFTRRFVHNLSWAAAGLALALLVASVPTPVDGGQTQARVHAIVSRVALNTEMDR